MHYSNNFDDGNKDICQIFKRLLEKKHEGSYWDFKYEWYKKDNNERCLIDILCMANNLNDSDAYIFLGVEDKTFNIVGVDNDPNRRDTQRITDFLKSKKFLGDMRPNVCVKSFLYNNKTIDAIVVENSRNTPFMLKEDYGNVKKGIVYTRIEDTNTPIDSLADIDKQEILWKKRFGIDKNIMERLNIVLDDWNNWGFYDSECNFKQGFFSDENIMFNRFYPEFNMKIIVDSERNWDKETIMCFYPNHNVTSYKCNVYYLNSLIYSFHLCYVDEFRKLLVVPKISYFYCNDKIISFYYLTLDSIIGKIQRIFTSDNYSTESRFAGNYWLLYFKNKNELEKFKSYATDSELYNSNLKNGEIEIGAEANYANIKMADINNAFYIYIKYLLDYSILLESDYSEYLTEYFKYYKSLN